MVFRTKGTAQGQLLRGFRSEQIGNELLHLSFSARANSLAKWRRIMPAQSNSTVVGKPIAGLPKSNANAWRLAPSGSLYVGMPTPCCRINSPVWSATARLARDPCRWKKPTKTKSPDCRGILPQIDHVGKLHHARRTPRAPIVDEHDFAPRGIERNAIDCAGERLQFQNGNGIPTPGACVACSNSIFGRQNTCQHKTNTAATARVTQTAIGERFCTGGAA